MYRLQVFCLALLQLVGAQTLLSFFLLDTDPQSLVASVIDVQSATSTFEVTCPTGTDANDCGYIPPIRVTQAPGFAAADMTISGQFTMTWNCDITSSTVAAVCTQSLGGPQANDPGVTTATITGSDIEYFPVTVTAGADKLTASGPTSTASSTSNGTGGSAQSTTPTQTSSPSNTNAQSPQNTAGNSTNPNPTSGATSQSGTKAGLFAAIAGFLSLIF